MTARSLVTLGVIVALGACGSAPTALPGGPGLVSFDREAPEGAATFARPEWKVGDRFVYRHGGEQRVAVRVVAVDEREIALVDEVLGIRNVVDRDFGYLRLEEPDGGIVTRWDPVDARFSWPLWAGKRWACRYVLREHGGAELPVLAEYHCDALESVTVPAGSFEALRIWRRSRPLLEGDWLDRCDLFWYAPAIGQVVRRLEATVLTELESVQRQ
ncbi:MAG: hypothetical protein HZB39_14050 [Planctomycetes bacterium]|nr:hypothetical protein [Planctomycetota bacterium]